MFCLRCLNQIVGKKCQCEKPNTFIRKGRNYLYKGQTYNSEKWMLLMSESFLKTAYGIRDQEISDEYLHSMFEQNVNKTTLVRLILPAIILPLFSIVCIFILPFSSLDKSQILIAYFLSSFLIVIGIINLLRAFVFKIKIIARRLGRGIIHQQISYKKYLQIRSKL